MLLVYLPYQIQIKFYLILSYLILSYLILSYLIDINSNTLVIEIVEINETQ